MIQTIVAGSHNRIKETRGVPGGQKEFGHTQTNEQISFSTPFSVTVAISINRWRSMFAAVTQDQTFDCHKILERGGCDYDDRCVQVNCFVDSKNSIDDLTSPAAWFTVVYCKVFCWRRTNIIM
ncbi:hypothetical protein GWI33_009303 [Rhynchophorus ferrugineus]|uniref:Uncharacterized protein n=1 Tax=Rhynchophorus ferrugineus TaxID=354439 RepID=A0A834IPK2_RHYFE|nr:hypothetical protein GWI33_009303 [Rhynchophorus ferrugineus]